MAGKKVNIPDWFDIDRYSETLTPEEWLSALTLRKLIDDIWANTEGIAKAQEAFKSLVVERDLKDGGAEKLISEVPHFRELIGVRPPTALAISYLGSMIFESEFGKGLEREVRMLRLKKEFRRFIEDQPDSVQKARTLDFGELINWEAEVIEPNSVVNGFPVVVDLDQDDETLELAFKIWLAGARQESGEAPKPFSDNDFAAWGEFGILPARDLILWSKLEGCKLTNSQIANAIWPLAVPQFGVGPPQPIETE